MTEMDVLDLFYDQLRIEGETREELFISLDDSCAEKISHKLGKQVKLSDIQRLADICIANEWLERTTADPDYNYLSMTEAGLQMAVANQYTNK
jgi:hypothetical protein